MNAKGISWSSTRKIFLALTVVVYCVGSQSVWAQDKDGPGKVYRWVDEDGKVHYSETLPPNWNQETHDELDARGIVREEGVSRTPPPPAAAKPEPEAEVDPATVKTELPRDKSGLKRADPLFTDAETQQRMDRMLLLRYHSEEEIVEAMEVEIQQLQYDARLLNSTRASLEADLKSKIKVAGDRQRAGLEVTDEALASIANVRSRLDRNDKSLESLKIREQGLRSDFNQNLERYRELSEKYSEEDS